MIAWCWYHHQSFLSISDIKPKQCCELLGTLSNKNVKNGNRKLIFSLFQCYLNKFIQQELKQRHLELCETKVFHQVRHRSSSRCSWRPGCQRSRCLSLLLFLHKTVNWMKKGGWGEFYNLWTLKMIKRAELTIIANTYSSDPLSVTLESLHTKTIKSDYTMSSPISEGNKGNEVASYKLLMKTHIPCG